MQLLQVLPVLLSLLVCLPTYAVRKGSDAQATSQPKHETAKSDRAKHIRNNLLQPAYDALFKKDLLLSDVERLAAENWEDVFKQIDEFVKAYDSTQATKAQRLHAIGTELLKTLQDIVQYDVIRERSGKVYQINFGRAAKRILDTLHDQELDALKETLAPALEKHRKGTFTAKEKGDVSGLLLEEIALLEKASDKISQELSTLKTMAYAMRNVQSGSPDYQNARIIVREVV